MNKFFFFFTFSFLLGSNPSFSESNILKYRTSFNFHTEKLFGKQQELEASDANIEYSIKYNNQLLSSNLILNHHTQNGLNFDGSNLQFSKGNAQFGFGKINRNWSFSKNSSLILSSNARPIESIYFKFENKFDLNFLPSSTNWSIEIINGATQKSRNKGQSMLFGARAVISPIQNLKFELFQTSQWGGNKDKINSNMLTGILFGNTNEGNSAYINKMAGFGALYQMPVSYLPISIYGQTVGEDEAGNLPSCLSYLAGIEWSLLELKYPTTATFEFIDTRTQVSTNGFCGPNSMYNNSNYDYVNYDKSLGASIDSEGTSLEFLGQTFINNNLSVKYSHKILTINDTANVTHRLTSNRETGSITSLGLSWKKNRFNINGYINQQNLTLDKASIKRGTALGLSTSITF